MKWPVVNLSTALASAEVFVDGDWVESKDQDPKGDVRLIQLADVGDGVYINKSSRFLTSAKAHELKCTFLKEGDILVARMPDPLGRSCIFPGDPKPSVTVVDVCIIRPNCKLHDACWLMHCLNSSTCRNQIAGFATGTTRSRISRSNLGKIKIPLPPLPEQKRIADILDRAEALRAKRRTTLAQLDELTQAIFIEMFGDPVINPLGWNTKKLEKLCVKIFGGGTPSKSRQEYYEGNIPWVTPKDMKLDFIQDSIDHISAQAVEESSTKLIPPNSLLMVIRSGILKKKLPVAINICEVTMNQDMKGFLFDNRLTNSYFMLYFFKIYQRDLLNRVRSVTADNLEFDQIKDINVIIPPIDKQQKFALRVAAVGKLKATHKASLAELDELFASLQYRVFRGEL